MFEYNKQVKFNLTISKPPTLASLTDIHNLNLPFISTLRQFCRSKRAVKACSSRTFASGHGSSRTAHEKRETVTCIRTANYPQRDDIKQKFLY